MKMPNRPASGSCGGRVKRFFGWWVAGPWWARAGKLVVLAVILYNAVAFFLMWCPPVKGVVLDIETGKPIAGAIVQKSGLGPFVFPMGYPIIGGAHAQTKTDGEGRFSFPGAFAHPTPRTDSWFNVLWPFQWLNTIDIAVWHPNYIGLASSAEGLWWNEMPPGHSAGYCRVTRTRRPFLGFRYVIFLRRPVTEADWEAKIGSVNLGGGKEGTEAEQGRLFNDLTGYLERWPQGEKAGEYYKLLWETDAFRSCEFMRQDFNTGQLSRKDLMLYYDRGSKIITLAKSFSSPPGGMDRASFQQGLTEHEASIQCAKELLGSVIPGRKEGTR